MRRGFGWLAVLASSCAIGVFAYVVVGGMQGATVSSFDEGHSWPMWVFFVSVPVALIAGIVWTALFGTNREARMAEQDMDRAL